MIIEHLDADKESLKACSLVESRWFDPSRRHLFRSLHVRTVCLNVVNRLQKFLNFLKDTPSVRGYVEVLTLRNDYFASVRRLGLRSLVLILTLLPNVQELTLEHLLFMCGPNPGKQLTPPPPRSLRTLCLRTCQVKEGDPFLSYVLGCFTHVQQLQLPWNWDADHFLALQPASKFCVYELEMTFNRAAIVTRAVAVLGPHLRRLCLIEEDSTGEYPVSLYNGVMMGLTSPFSRSCEKRRFTPHLTSQPDALY